MAQKVILCSGNYKEDLLSKQPLSDLIADGYTVTSVSGFASNDNRSMCYVLLSKSGSGSQTEGDGNPDAGQQEEQQDEYYPTEDAGGV